jgi:hypothetical protein
MHGLFTPRSQAQILCEMDFRRCINNLHQNEGMLSALRGLLVQNTMNTMLMKRSFSDTQKFQDINTVKKRDSSNSYGPNNSVSQAVHSIKKPDSSLSAPPTLSSLNNVTTNPNNHSVPSRNGTILVETVSNITTQDNNRRVDVKKPDNQIVISTSGALPGLGSNLDLSGLLNAISIQQPGVNVGIPSDTFIDAGLPLDQLPNPGILDIVPPADLQPPLHVGAAVPPSVPVANPLPPNPAPPVNPLTHPIHTQMTNPIAHPINNPMNPMAHPMNNPMNMMPMNNPMNMMPMNNPMNMMPINNPLNPLNNPMNNPLNPQNNPMNNPLNPLNNPMNNPTGNPMTNPMNPLSPGFSRPIPPMAHPNPLANPMVNPGATPMNTVTRINPFLMSVLGKPPFFFNSAEQIYGNIWVLLLNLIIGACLI